MNEKRQPQLMDTIGKAGNFWRIVDIDGDEITARRLYNGDVRTGGRPLKISKAKIEDGTFHLLDLPPVSCTTLEELQKEQEPEPEQEETDAVADVKAQIRRLRAEAKEKDKAISELEARLEKSKQRERDLADRLYESQHLLAKAEGKIAGIEFAASILFKGVKP